MLYGIGGGGGGEGEEEAEWSHSHTYWFVVFPRRYTISTATFLFLAPGNTNSHCNFGLLNAWGQGRGQEKGQGKGHRGAELGVGKGAVLEGKLAKGGAKINRLRVNVTNLMAAESSRFLLWNAIKMSWSKLFYSVNLLAFLLLWYFVSKMISISVHVSF